MFVILHVKKKSNAGVPGSLSALSRHIRAIFAVVSSSFSSLSSFATSDKCVLMLRVCITKNEKSRKRGPKG